MTTCTRRLFPLLLALALSAPAVWGCAAATPEPGPVEWDLSPEAYSTYHFLLLEDAKRNHDLEAGEYALQQLIRHDPAPDIFYEGAEFYWTAGELSKAGDVLILGLELYPEDTQIMLMLARVYYAEENLGLAAEILSEYVALVPEDFESRQDLIDVLIQAGMYEEALEALDEVPSELETLAIRYYRARALVGAERYREAASILEKIVDENPDIVEAWAELAYVYELLEDYEGAERTYQAILDLGETSQELWIRLVDLNLKLNKPDKALELVAKGPEELSFHLSAATLFMDYGQYDLAEQVLLPLLDRDPPPLEVHFYLALLEYEGRGNAEAAVEHLEKIPEDNEHFDRSLRFRVHLLYEAGDKDRAVALADEARQKYPDQREFWVLHIRLLQDQEDYAAALTVNEQALELWPDDTELLYLDGVALDLTHRTDEAMEVMERTIELDPEYPEALNYVGYTLADQGRDLDRALSLVVKALQYKPESGYIIDSLAWVYFRQDRNDLAWDEIQRAVEFVPDDPVIWEHYGDIAAAMGLTDKAREGYAKALEFEPEDPQAVQSKLDEL